MLLGGRGAGKTRAGSEWIREITVGHALNENISGGRIALIGETYHDIRDVMIEGNSGILSVHARWERPQWNSSLRKLEWRNGIIAQAFSASDPESIRGSQFGAAWCDEICKWKEMEYCWDMLQFALRLGSSPRQMITTTPKPSKFLDKLLSDPHVIVDRSSTRENSANLAAGFIEYIENKYGGTAIGRQELEAEILDDDGSALWNRQLIKNAFAKPLLPWRRIVIAVDPPASSGARSAACGIVGVGHDANGTCFVICDASVEKASPMHWASAVVNTYHRLEADVIIAENNQGGEMIEAVLHTVDPTLAVRSVRATRNKWTRAEPVAMLYEQGRVKHAMAFRELEDEMCNFALDGTSDGHSPDRVDALVWAISELELQSKQKPRIRQLR